MVLYRSNLNILGLCRTWDTIKVEDLPVKGGRLERKFNIKESAQVMYFWRYLNRLIIDEFNEAPDMYCSPEEDRYEVLRERYGDRKKILYLMLLLLDYRVSQRIRMLGGDDQRELNTNREYWEEFNAYWRLLMAIAFREAWNWKEFSKKAELMVKNLLILEKVITTENNTCMAE
jgi:hypothetical protein